MKFYKCNKCGQILTVFEPKCPGITCCGESVSELVPNTADAAHEKHVPVIELADGSKVLVKVSSVEHPMLEAHFIEWVMLETSRGAYRVNLKPGEKPEASFTLSDGEKAVAAYAYCNLHGLWKAEV